ncbi:unnamed protein product [Microthlaspi erraticum]|uniref:Uncharacterized protein n=1 Tax=Microthlaspi erraticum TaxID=1685480 RepID=A0A6D2IF25_9BRAS|nr:unnamed protein product [Microthlaspi erraticum]
MVKKIYHKKNVHSWRDLDGRAEPLHARPCPLKPPNTPSHLIPSASHPSHLTTLAFHHYHHSTAFTILQVLLCLGTSKDLSQICIRPSEVSAKIQNRPADHNTTRETLSRGRPRHNRSRQPRTTRAARPENNASRPRNFTRIPRTNAWRNTSRPAERTIDHSTIRPTTRRPRTSGHDRSGANNPTVRPIVPTDRPNAAVDPKPFLKPNPHNSSPKPAPT